MVALEEEKREQGGMEDMRGIMRCGGNYFHEEVRSCGGKEEESKKLLPYLREKKNEGKR